MNFTWQWSSIPFDDTGIILPKIKASGRFLSKKLLRILAGCRAGGFQGILLRKIATKWIYNRFPTQVHENFDGKNEKIEGIMSPGYV
jgi:hypothetical protein